MREKIKQIKKKKTGKSPMDCNTNKDVCNQKTDGHHLKDFWICSDGREVTIMEQTSGEGAKQSITVPKGKFDRLIKWYLKKQ